MKLTTIILVALFLSFCPSLIASKIVLEYLIEDTSIDIETVARFLVTLPVMFNSVVNPVIYAVKKRQFRVAFVELLSRKNYQEAKDFEKRLFRSSSDITTRSGENAKEKIEDEVQVN